MTFLEIETKVFNTLDNMRVRIMNNGGNEISDINKHLETIDILDTHMSTIFDINVVPDDNIAFAFATSLIYKELLGIQKIACEHCDNDMIQIIETASQELFITALSE